MADGSVLIDTKLDEDGLAEGLSSLGSKIESGIATALKAATAALAAVGAYSVKVGSDYEAAIAGVAATMGTTVDQIGEISDKAKELGASTAFSASQAAEGFNILAQSGLKVDEQLATIDATLALAAAGEMLRRRRRLRNSELLRSRKLQQIRDRRANLQSRLSRSLYSACLSIRLRPF